MSTRSRSTHSTDTARRKKRGGSERTEEVSESQVEELVKQRRETLVSERQAAVERVLDEHDSLVRMFFFFKMGSERRYFRCESHSNWINS